MEVKKEELANLTNDLRRIIEAKDAETALAKEQAAKIEGMLDKHEAKSAEIVAQLAQERKANEELKEQFELIEKKLSRMPKGHAENAEAKVEMKALEDFVRFGTRNAEIEKQIQKKYLRTDVDIDGGFLCPEDYVTELLKKITEISPVRQVSRVRTTNRESIRLPKRQNLLSGYWVGEGQDMTDNNSNYGDEIIKVNLLAAYSIATVQMLQDSAFNMEAEINADIMERFAQLEGAAFINGDGIEKPEGILTNSEIQQVNSGVANDITADSLISLTGELKQGYNPTFMLNRRTLARIRRLKDGNGQYLWMPGLSDGRPNTILGEPYLSAIDMPDISAGSLPVLYGDFARGYNIVDSTTMTMVRDPYVLASSHKVRFLAHRRVGAQVVMAEAIKALKVSA